VRVQDPAAATALEVVAGGRLYQVGGVRGVWRGWGEFGGVGLEVGAGWGGGRLR